MSRIQYNLLIILIFVWCIILYISTLYIHMFKYIALVLLVLSVSGFQIVTKDESNESFEAIPWPFNTCGDGAWTIESLTLDQTPKRNTNDDIIVTGTANDSVTFKRADILVKLNGVFLDNQSADFTSSYDAGDAIEFKYTNFIPSFAPVGTYGLTFQFYDSKNQKNGCLAFQFKL